MDMGCCYSEFHALDMSYILFKFAIIFYILVNW